MSKINRDFFFGYVRGALFDGSIKASQNGGLTTILDYWDAKLAAKDDRWLAYALGTVHHETGRTMQPVMEYGTKAYKRQLYDVTGANPARARLNGNTEEGDGIKYCGRGYVQLTWKNNYRKAGQALGLDLVTSPSQAMDPSVAVQILFKGMIGGWFTGRNLEKFLSGEKSDWRNARKIVNGLDKADLIKGYALRYYAALSYTT